MIEGDSATCAELYALLSALSGVPGPAGIAVTGSMDQNGAVQPIGGVNEKIEGFFDLCRLRGTRRVAGGPDPGRNRRNLVLKTRSCRRPRGDVPASSRSTAWKKGSSVDGIPGGGDRAGGGVPHRDRSTGKVMDRIGELRDAVKGEENGERKGKRKGRNRARPNADLPPWSRFRGFSPLPKVPFVKLLEDLLEPIPVGDGQGRR